MANRCSCSCGLWYNQGYPALSSMFAGLSARCGMQIKDHIQTLGAAPDDEPVQQFETFRAVVLKQAVMQRNSNGVEPGPMQERDVFPRDVVLAVLLPECGRPFRSKQLQHQPADLARRLRATLEQPHITLWH